MTQKKTPKVPPIPGTKPPAIPKVPKPMNPKQATQGLMGKGQGMFGKLAGKTPVQPLKKKKAK